MLATGLEAGKVLIRLDSSLVALEVARAEAAVEQARAALNEASRLSMKAGRLVADRFVPDTEVRAREANLAQADAELARAPKASWTSNRSDWHATSCVRHLPVLSVNGHAELGEWITPGTAVAELVAVDELWLDVRVPQQYWSKMAGELAVQAVADVDLRPQPGGSGSCAGAGQ